VAGGGQGCVVFATMAPLLSQGIKRVEVAIKFHFNSQARAVWAPLLDAPTCALSLAALLLHTSHVGHARAAASAQWRVQCV